MSEGGDPLTATQRGRTFIAPRSIGESLSWSRYARGEPCSHRFFSLHRTYTPKVPLHRPIHASDCARDGGTPPRPPGTCASFLRAGRRRRSFRLSRAISTT